MLPAALVQQLAPLLPERFTAEPRVHLGPYFEIDVCAFDGDGHESPWKQPAGEMGGAATATRTAPLPTLSVEVELDDQYAYEVLVFDQERGRRLVAAVEIVSPANKDRPANRRAFVTKCAALLQQGVCVSLVDLVTHRQSNLYTQLLAEFDRTDGAFTSGPTPIYAATCRLRDVAERRWLDTWAYPLAMGQRLPAVPLWLSEEFQVTLDLEAGYEDACRALRIG